MAKGKRRSWVPNQHGAWAMVAAPPLLGIVLGGASWIHLPLLAAWWVGYFAYFSLTQWLASKGRRNGVPLRNLGVATALLVLVSVVAAPELCWWAIAYLPLVSIAVNESRCRRDRGVVNDTVTVLAAGLMAPVVFTVGTGDAPWQISDEVWVLSGLLAAYFLGTVPYVKTNIRERGSRAWLIGSVLYHVGGIMAAAFAAAAGFTGAAHIVVWVLLAIRAGMVPVLRARASAVAGVRAKRWAMIIGVGEIVATIAVFLTLSPWLWCS